MQEYGLWAGMFQGSALICAMMLVLVWPRPPAPRDELLAAAGFCSVGAGVGGRLVWALVAAWRGEPDLLERLASHPLAGGFSSFGAMCGALCVGLLVARRWTATKAALADFVAPIGLCSLALARLGCLVHGCDFGRRLGQDWSWLAVRYHAHDAPAWRWFSAHGELLADGSSPGLFPMPALLAGATACGVMCLVVASRVREPWPEGLLATRLVLMYACVRAIGELGRHPGAGAHVGEWNINIVFAVCVGVSALVMQRRWRVHTSD